MRPRTPVLPGGLPAVAPGVPDPDTIRSIASWRGGGAVTSLYLDVDGRRWPRWSDVAPRLGGLLRQARSAGGTPVGGAPAGAPGSSEHQADVEAIGAWFGDGSLDRSTTRGVAVFAGGGQGVFAAVELPGPVRDQVVVDREPDVAQLCLVAASTASALAVGVDGQRWRLARTDAGNGLRELDVLDDTVPRRVDVDREGHKVERHGEELAREHARHVTSRVAAELDARPADHVVLWGPERAVALLVAHLPARVAARVAGRVVLPLDAPLPEVEVAVKGVVAEARRDRLSALVHDVRGTVAGNPTAVAGLPATLQALADERVATLVVERGFEATGGRCDACHLLVTVSGGGCPRCGAPVRPVANVVDTAIDDAFLRGVAVEPVDDGELADVGCVGAVVRPAAATREVGDA